MSCEICKGYGLVKIHPYVCKNCEDYGKSRYCYKCENTNKTGYKECDICLGTGDIEKSIIKNSK
jgi:DnaJ-class molecular chaperone